MQLWGGGGLSNRTEACETRKYCAQCPSPLVEVSRQLAALVPTRQRRGDNLIVRVGLARYHGRQRRSEIREDLARLGAAHREALLQERRRAAADEEGGLPCLAISIVPNWILLSHEVRSAGHRRWTC